MRYGYVRVSTKGQNTARQDVLMKELGVDRVFVDKCTGENVNRPEFQKMMSELKEGDVVVIESYSRMSRSTKDLLDTVEKLNKMGVGFVSKKENIDTMTASGRLLLTIIAGINQFEREVMLERQAEGIAVMPVVDGKKVSAKTGNCFGRPVVEVDTEVFTNVYTEVKRGMMSVKMACEKLNISRSKWYRMVNHV